MATRRAFTPEELGLLQAAHATPRDDAPRLVYADWLEDHGEPLRAEFIRLQCARAAAVGVAESLRGAGLTDRERELDRDHGRSWAAPIARYTTLLKFLRGFPLLDVSGGAYSDKRSRNLVPRSNPGARFRFELFGWVRDHLDNPVLARAAVLVANVRREEDIPLLATCPHLGMMELLCVHLPRRYSRVQYERLLGPLAPLQITGGQ